MRSIDNDNMLPPIWAIVLIIGLVLLISVTMAMFGLIGLGFWVIIWLIGAIAIGIGGYGLIEEVFGDLGSFIEWIGELTGLEIAAETLQILTALVL